MPAVIIAIGLIVAAILNGGIYETRVGSLRGEMPVVLRTNRFTGAMKLCFPTGLCIKLPKSAPASAPVAANDFLKGAVRLEDDAGIFVRPLASELLREDYVKELFADPHFKDLPKEKQVAALREVLIRRNSDYSHLPPNWQTERAQEMLAEAAPQAALQK